MKFLPRDFVSQIRIRICLGVLSAMAVVSVPARGQTAENEYQKFIDAIVLVIVEQEFADGRVVNLSEGTGFIVDESGYILTAKHLFGADDDGAVRTRAYVVIKSRVLNPRVQADRVEYSPGNDFVLLKLPSVGQSWRHVIIGDPKRVEPGETVVSMGFPLGMDRSVLIGQVVNKAGPKASWTTKLGSVPGMSGAPVFNSRGQVVGVVHGGPGWPGYDFIAPINHAHALLQIPPAIWTKDSVPIAPPEIRRIYSIRQTKDDHPILLAPHSRRYTVEFNADAAYKITSAELLQNSATRVSDLTVNVLDGGERVVVQFSLTSGPSIDRYRGWLDGQLVTTQVKKN